ncbi:MAG: exodeoxyribonuclease VII large subunit [Alphaproteobacteria bacterium]|nr:exodeoxyribonuclease VII large subunit [Alphaproteobacteria bacterium]
MSKTTSKPPDEGLFAPSLIDKPREGRNAPEYTVSDLSRQVKRMVEDGFGHVRVRGEIGECKLHTSGHLYLSLKDEGAVLAAVCWKGQVAKLGLKPATGMDVVCTGKLTTFAGQSKYQLIVESMALAGVGALLKMLEERRVKLQQEGLFDPARKRALPFLPEVIGVVTSPTGAVIRDILHRLADRFPRRVLVWPVPVQGEGAAQKIAAAVRGFNALEKGGAVPRPDVLIVARGGGSLEDLMPFNEEEVVRAVAESRIPVISAVGHETDTTLVDYAADLRAPTPTAAAEKAVPVRLALVGAVDEMDMRLENAAFRLLDQREEKLQLLSHALGDPMRALTPLMQRFDALSERLAAAEENYLHRQKSRLAELAGRLRHPRDVMALARTKLEGLAKQLGTAEAHYLHDRKGRLAEMAGRLRHPRELMAQGQSRLTIAQGRLKAAYGAQVMQTGKKLDRLTVLLEALSPRAVLGRGYALIYDAKGQLITRCADLAAGENVRIELQDGQREASVT